MPATITYRTSVVFGNAISATEPSGAITPAVGDIFIVACSALGNTNATPTCSDNNGITNTYTLIGTAAFGTNTNTLSIFVRDKPIFNTTSTTVTITIGAHTSVECCVLAFAQGQKTGSSAIRSSGKTENSTDPPTATLNQEAYTYNPTIAIVGYDGGGVVSGTYLSPSGWTERQDACPSGAASIEVCTRNGVPSAGFTGTVINWQASGIIRNNASYVLELDSTLSGQILTVPTMINGYLDIDAEFYSIAYPESHINVRQNYSLACYDTNGTRHFWVDNNVSLNNAPDPSPYSYVENTLVILAKF